MLLPPSGPVSRTVGGRLLAGLAGFHQAYEDEDIADLCPPEARFRMAAPATQRADTGPNPHPRRDEILAGWDTFAELVPAEVVDAVFAVHAHPESLTSPLIAAAPSTLLHGDAKLENLGLAGGRLVAIDWGDLTGIGPAEIEVTYFAVHGGWRIDWMPDDVFAAYNLYASRPLEPSALDLACIGSLAQVGFRMAIRCRATDEGTCVRASALLDWWVTRVRDALSRWSPI